MSARITSPAVIWVHQAGPELTYSFGAACKTGGGPFLSPPRSDSERTLRLADIAIVSVNQSVVLYQWEKMLPVDLVLRSGIFGRASLLPGPFFPAPFLPFFCPVLVSPDL